MLDTPIGKEILQMGVKKGLEKGLEKGSARAFPKGAQHILLRQVVMRFGKVPEGIRRKIVAMKDTKELDRIAMAVLTTRNLSELKKAF